MYGLMALLWLLTGCESQVEPAVLREMNCEKGDMDACFQIGHSALTQARPNIKQARSMFAKGCNVHHARSCNGLAEMVRDAKGGPRDPKRAAELFAIACNGGVQSACVNLGISYYDGHGVKQDHEKAVELLTGACEHPDDPQSKGCSALGVAYSEGKGVKKDLVKAEELQTNACNAGYAPGCVLAGHLYQERRTGKRSENLMAAADLLEKACKLNPHFGCFELAVMHESKTAPDASDAKAAIFYQKTCNNDPTRGCYEAARLMELGKISAREGEIESLYNLACEHGHTEACAKRSLDL